ncbi:MAG: hypothetical protein GY953_16170, partial [bacterium]|nr:hypothetical protein [bacterium]
MTATMLSYYRRVLQQFLAELKQIGWIRIVLFAVLAAAALAARVLLGMFPADRAGLTLFLAPHIVLAIGLLPWALLKAPVTLDSALREQIAASRTEAYDNKVTAFVRAAWEEVRHDASAKDVVFHLLNHQDMAYEDLHAAVRTMGEFELGFGGTINHLQHTGLIGTRQ